MDKARTIVNLVDDLVDAKIDLREVKNEFAGANIQRAKDKIDRIKREILRVLKD